jgi:hypothetical protein
MFTVKIPKVGKVSADSIQALGDAAWTAVHTAPNGYGTGYGASEVGSGWPVTHDGKKVGTLRYNGRFDAAVAS